MKKTTAVILTALLTVSTPAMAERNPNDPYEGYNRFMFKVNDTADRYVLSPVARGYRKITPRPVRTGVTNFYNNLRDVVSFGSNLLRLDVKRASEDLVRVGINTTFGLGGLINIADAGDMPNNKNTLGDTFASWGWKKSHYFVYPLTGPSTVRDSVGSTLVSVYPLDSAIFKESGVLWSERALNAVNTREQFLDLTDSLDNAALDRYAATRDVYMQMRARQLGIAPPQNEASDDLDIDQLVAPDSGNTGADNLPTAPQETAEATQNQPVETAPAPAANDEPRADDYVPIRPQAAAIY